jgi:uncharacterized protein YndB with AHSA1/START domain
MSPGSEGREAAKIDARVGGRYWFEVREPNGAVHVTTGEYLELVPDRRIVKTWVYEGPLKEFAQHLTRVTIELREVAPNRTELTLSHERLPDQKYRDSVTTGWNDCLNGLDEVVAARSYGAVTDRGTIRIQRVLPGPIERVWAYLTESEKRAKWLASGPMELRTGGKLTLNFRHADLSPRKEPTPACYKQYENGVGFSGTVTRCDPPRLLSYTWAESDGSASEVTFELTPQGENVLLMLTHRRLPDRKTMVDVAAGWHNHLDVLVDHLYGLDPQPFWTTHTRLEGVYEKRLPADA